LAFDSLFTEGQRRYFEYLSSQARNWIKQVPKPAIDYIEGLSPTLAVSQGRCSLSTRGTIATYTDIYDFLALLFAKIGEQYSPITRQKLTRFSRQEIIENILREYPLKTRLQLLAPLSLGEEKLEDAVHRLQQMGFARLKFGEEEWTGDTPIPSSDFSTIDVVIDRLEIKENIRERLATSVEMALELSRGILKIQEGKQEPTRFLSEVYVCPETSFSFAPLEPIDFNFNSIRGACPLCNGKGGTAKINPTWLFDPPYPPLLEQINLLLSYIPKKIANSFSTLWKLFLQKHPIDKAQTTQNISPEILQQLLYGSSYDKLHVPILFGNPLEHIVTEWQGIIPFLNRVLQDRKSRGNLLSLPVTEWQICPDCRGSRLKTESLSCLIHGINISTLCNQTVDEMKHTIEDWQFTHKELAIADQILPHIQKRLQFLSEVGLGYLSLNRQGNTLSDGEAQRIQLASQIGAKLSGLIYILDEPSLGLHPQDMDYLWQIIAQLKKLDNTIIVVEHERSIIQQADHIVELGPGAGRLGGMITFEGTFSELIENSNSLTGPWLKGTRTFSAPPRRKSLDTLSVQQASQHNLHQVSLEIPMKCLVGFCGVSGSGKSTLVELVGRHIQQQLTHSSTLQSIDGGESIQRVIFGQKQAEKFTARSLPATYVDIMTPLRKLFAETRLAKARGYSAARFSLHKRGGRCEACEGTGCLHVDMQLMADLFIPCKVCQGLRYNYETLQVTWEGRHIADVLNLTVEEAAKVFQYIPSLAPTLVYMEELGLNYLTLGQPCNTLSGGEIQRLKLVADLAQRHTEPTLYILDEPSTGLHYEDIQKLITILHRLVEKGHSVFMIEHNLNLLYQCDWVIELGPGGGPKGGKILFQGSPEELKKTSTPTGKAYLNQL
jgi:excinuclease ABC subunit A